MARQRVDARLAVLARRRADLSSAHFGLAYLVQDATDTLASGERLAMSVPKRQLKRAVDRNQLKRIAREAWRLQAWGDAPRPALVVMLKLRRTEADWKTSGRTALKKAWRAELDELFLRMRRRVRAQALRNGLPDA